MACRQCRAASSAQSGVFTEMPRCAKQLVCRQLWPVHMCRLGELGVTAKALMQAETVQLGITAHAPTQMCRAAATVMVQNCPALACPSLCTHRDPCWTWGQTARRGRTAFCFAEDLAQKDLSLVTPSELLGRLREMMQRKEETAV